MEEDFRVNRCYPGLNTSCTKSVRSQTLYTIMYTFLSVLSVSTVFLNLLIIISISHFKQLHTPTNLLLLSLAVADFLTGLIIMPVEGTRLIETCWYFGDVMCNIFPLISSVVVAGSLFSLILISVDRFVAITYPLRYSLNVTHNKALIIVVISWCCCLLYFFNVFYDHLTELSPHRTCHGECLLKVSFQWIICDITVSFILPCSTLIGLNMKIFCTARYQVKVINSVTGRVRGNNKERMTQESSSKAAKKTVIIVTVYLLCYLPYHLGIPAYGTQSSPFLMNCLIWIININSCMNPIIYALLYPWFKVSTKHIITLAIRHPGSAYFSVNSDVK